MTLFARNYAVSQRHSVTMRHTPFQRPPSVSGGNPGCESRVIEELQAAQLWSWSLPSVHLLISAWFRESGRLLPWPHHQVEWWDVPILPLSSLFSQPVLLWCVLLAPESPLQLLSLGLTIHCLHVIIISKGAVVILFWTIFLEHLWVDRKTKGKVPRLLRYLLPPQMHSPPHHQHPHWEAPLLQLMSLYEHLTVPPRPSLGRGSPCCASRGSGQLYDGGQLYVSTIQNHAAQSHWLKDPLCTFCLCPQM